MNYCQICAAKLEDGQRCPIHPHSRVLPEEQAWSKEPELCEILRRQQEIFESDKPDAWKNKELTAEMLKGQHKKWLEEQEYHDMMSQRKTPAERIKENILDFAGCPDDYDIDKVVAECIEIARDK